ncbi:MAG: FtsX-like permease family protein [Anaerolineales bacterium]|nr:FtsX-like permease family protein [Anaerolineales bacterium]
MRVAFNKVRRDLWRNKARTLLVVLSIAVGVMALGMVTAGSNLILSQMENSHKASNPAHGMIWLGGVIDETTLHSLEKLDSVASVEGISESGIRWRTAPDAEWQDATLIAYENFTNQKFDRQTLLDGVWPTDYLAAVEGAHIDSFGVPGVGGSVYFEVNDRPREIHVGGVVRDPFEFPKPFGSQATFFVTDNMLENLTGFRGYTRIRFTVPEYSEENVNTAIQDIQDKLEKLGVGIGWQEVLHPEQHYLQEMINGVTMVLAVMAVASLGLSTILVVNTINALITQQVPQIGIMKAVGGLRKQIALLYLSGVIVYGLLSLLIAVPLGAYGGAVMSQWMLFLLNVPARPFELLPSTLVMQLLTGLLTPLLAALFPILQGAGIAVANALNRYGLGAGKYGARWLDRILGKVRSLPRLFTLSLRNTFRRPGRVIMTQLTLTVAGAVFLMVVSTQYSFNSTIETIFKGFGYDIAMGFQQYQLTEEVVPLIEAYPGVDRAELWMSRSIKASVPGVTPDGEEREVYMYGVPDDSELFSPQLIAGRLLVPDDGQAILLNQKEAKRLGVGVGDTIKVEMSGVQDSTWTVVGLIFDLSGNDQNTAYVPLDSLSMTVNRVGRATYAQIKVDADSLAGQQEIAKGLSDFLEAEGVPAGGYQIALETQEQANAQFGVLTQVLMFMTILMAAVGSIGMSGTLSINVIERTREIGVMRAVGASSRDVGFVFTWEGLMLGVLSWLLAVPIGLLGGPKFVIALGDVIDFPAEYYPAFHGVWIWLAIVVVLSVVASWAPARRATLISVSDSLAYE